MLLGRKRERLEDLGDGGDRRVLVNAKVDAGVAKNFFGGAFAA